MGRLSEKRAWAGPTHNRGPNRNYYWHCSFIKLLTEVRAVGVPQLPILFDLNSFRC